MLMALLAIFEAAHRYASSTHNHVSKQHIEMPVAVVVMFRPAHRYAGGSHNLLQSST
jgi:hypothetical protein